MNEDVVWKMHGSPSLHAYAQLIEFEAESSDEKSTSISSDVNYCCRFFLKSFIIPNMIEVAERAGQFCTVISHPHLLQ